MQWKYQVVPEALASHELQVYLCLFQWINKGLSEAICFIKFQALKFHAVCHALCVSDTALDTF